MIVVNEKLWFLKDVKMVFDEAIVPFEETEKFKLYQRINEVKATLAAMNDTLGTVLGVAFLNLMEI